jgi:hypothetical protein
LCLMGSGSFWHRCLHFRGAFLLNLDIVQLRCQLQLSYPSQGLFVIIIYLFVVVAAEIIIIYG